MAHFTKRQATIYKRFSLFNVALNCKLKLRGLEQSSCRLFKVDSVQSISKGTG